MNIEIQILKEHQTTNETRVFPIAANLGEARYITAVGLTPTDLTVSEFVRLHAEHAAERIGARLFTALIMEKLALVLKDGSTATT